MAKEFHKENIAKSAPPPMPAVKQYGSGKNLGNGPRGSKAGLSARSIPAGVKKGK